MQEQPLCSCVQVFVNEPSQKAQGKLTVVDLSSLLQSATKRPLSSAAFAAAAAGTKQANSTNRLSKNLEVQNRGCIVSKGRGSPFGRQDLDSTSHEQQRAARQHLSKLQKVVQQLAVHQQQGEGEQQKSSSMH